MTEPVYWWQADPDRLLIEYSELQERYPTFAVGLDTNEKVVFSGALTAVVWDLAAMRLRLTVRCPSGYPAVAPRVVDNDDLVPDEHRGSHYWHVNLDGSICFGDPRTWSPQFLIADLVAKVGDWMVNTIALDAGVVESMPASGRVSLPGRQVVIA